MRLHSRRNGERSPRRSIRSSNSKRVNGVLPANGERLAFRMLAAAIIAGTASVLLLSAAGIYAMMSFTVSRRRREIGIRAALGADARRVVTGIFGRASAQLGAGIGAGLAIASAFEWLVPAAPWAVTRTLFFLPLSP